MSFFNLSPGRLSEAKLFQNGCRIPFTKLPLTKSQFERIFPRKNANSIPFKECESIKKFVLGSCDNHDSVKFF